jgi:putative DNA primase/helicase
VVDDADNDKTRLFVRANLAPDKHALRFGVGTRHVGNDRDTDVEIWAPHVVWDSEHVEVTATEAMEAAESGGASARARRKEAEEFLRSRLAGGPVLQKDIEEEAKANCISYRTLRRAQKDLGVRAAKQQGKLGGVWLWELPKVPKYDRD